MSELLGEVNRSIRDLASTVDPHDSSTWEFVCECGEEGCTERFGLPLARYDDLNQLDRSHDLRVCRVDLLAAQLTDAEGVDHESKLAPAPDVDPAAVFLKNLDQAVQSACRPWASTSSGSCGIGSATAPESAGRGGTFLTSAGSPSPPIRRNRLMRVQILVIRLWRGC